MENNQQSMQLRKGEGEIILYQPEETMRLEVRVENETVWLNRNQMAMLFDRDVKTIGKHINNALQQELKGVSVVAKFATTASDGKSYNVEHFNIDVILSVGYRVKSSRGIEFRQWANRVLKDYLFQGFAVNHRLNNLESRMSQVEGKIDFFVRTSLPPVEGVFFDGQIFDAFSFAADLIRSARKRVVLIDNYIDDTVLTLLVKRGKGVEAQIITRSVSKQLSLDLDRHNAQYEPIIINESNRYHDRFLIIDDVVYHIGASMKDLGKKLFAFSRLSVPVKDILS